MGPSYQIFLGCAGQNLPGWPSLLLFSQNKEEWNSKIPWVTPPRVLDLCIWSPVVGSLRWWVPPIALRGLAPGALTWGCSLLSPVAGCASFSGFMPAGAGFSWVGRDIPSHLCCFSSTANVWDFPVPWTTFYDGIRGALSHTQGKRAFKTCWRSCVCPSISGLGGCREGKQPFSLCPLCSGFVGMGNPLLSESLGAVSPSLVTLHVPK